MKILLESSERGKRGYALVIAMLFLLVITGTFISVWLWTATNSAIAQRNNTFNQSSGAAEAATEKVFSQMDRDFLFGNLGTSNTYNSIIPDTSTWPVQYTFSDGQGNNSQIAVSIGTTNFEVLNSQYAGLSGIAQDCTITAIATPSGQRYNVPATVTQTFQAAIIPVFQFAIFYNLNLEMAPGQPLTVAGPVFCNASIWEGSSDLNFSSTVQAVGTNNTSAVDPFNPTYTNGTVSVAGSTASYSGTPEVNFSQGPPSDHNNSLTMPIGTSTNSNPTNVESILNIPPAGLGAPNSAAYNTTNQIYLYNECDLIVSNASYGTNGYATTAALGTTVDYHTNFTVWFQDPKNSPNYLTLLTNDLVMLKTYTGSYTNTVTHTGGLNITNYAATNIFYAGYSFLTNVSFYDYRESATIQAVQFDIQKFRRWLTNTYSPSIVSTNGTMNTYAGYTLENSYLRPDVGHGFRSVYIYNSVPLSGSQLPAVRLVNGSLLPTNNPGLTVATPQPAYVQGNYNVQNAAGVSDAGTNVTTHTYPAAVLADAITILSVDWNDSYTNSDPTGANGPDDTTINFAALEGIVQTNPNISGNYSGGVENFLRLVEDWNTSQSHSGRSILTYNGSIVVMFPSIYATNSWSGNPITFYGVPTRHWAFDLNFETAAGLPPLSPSSRALIRNNWSAY